jgi:hypothetical protein
MACFSFTIWFVHSFPILYYIDFFPLEKEQARTMINSALQGFKESERTSNPSPQQPVDFDSLSNFVEK